MCVCWGVSVGVGRYKYVGRFRYQGNVRLILLVRMKLYLQPGPRSKLSSVGSNHLYIYIYMVKLLRSSRIVIVSPHRGSCPTMFRIGDYGVTSV